MFLLGQQVACMQFINIVVHSVEDMNFRVHLQFEFTKLGLDDFLEVTSCFNIQYTRVELKCAFNVRSYIFSCLLKALLQFRYL